jgi:1,2-diacylglycerol 3-alpha-glucosyltransferase
MKKQSRDINICLISRRFQIMSRATDMGYIWSIATGLVERGFRVTVISYSSPINKYEIEREGVKAYFLNDQGSPFIRTSFEESVYQKFIELHKTKPFDIVHSLDASGLKIAKSRKQFKVKFVFDVEATQISQIFSIIGMSQETVSGILTTFAALLYKFLTTYLKKDREILKNADSVFVNHPQQRVMLERYYLYPDFHIYSLPYGVEIGQLELREKPLDLKKNLGLPEISQIALTLSDMTEMDEIINILVSFEKVALKKPNAHLIIVGKGPLMNQIELEILNRVLGSRVILTGALKSQELFDYISLCDIFVNLSSRTTGLEPAQIEAMSQKKLIIGSEVSPLSNIIEDGMDGFLIRPADTESLANLIIEIFSGTLPIDEMGEKARQKVLEMFDRKKMISGIYNAYLKILGVSPN